MYGFLALLSNFRVRITWLKKEVSTSCVVKGSHFLLVADREQLSDEKFFFEISRNL